MSHENRPITADLLYGAAAIAAHLEVKRSVVYHLAETERLPHWKEGAVLCALRSTLDQHFQMRQQTYVPPPKKRRSKNRMEVAGAPA
jgi:hypothetical protein